MSATPAIPAEDWTISDRPYPFWLSRFRFGQVTLRTAQYSKHFTTLPPQLDDSIVPFDTVGREADVLVVRPQPIAEAMPVVTLLPHAVRYAPMQYRRSYTDLGGSFDDYLKKFSAKTRKGIQRSIRHYNEHVKDENPIRRFEGEAGIIEFQRLAREVAKKTYQEKLTGGGLPAGDDYLAQMRRLASDGRARGYVLMHGDRPVSYVYLIANLGVMNFESTGYDTEYKDFSPGRCLLYSVHKDLFDEHQYPLFDYGEQEGPHKELFGTHHTLVAHVFYFMRRPRPLSVVAAQAGLNYVGTEVKSALAKYEIEERARKIIGLARS
jgi:hypothetical protein